MFMLHSQNHRKTSKSKWFLPALIMDGRWLKLRRDPHMITAHIFLCRKCLPPMQSGDRSENHQTERNEVMNNFHARWKHFPQSVFHLSNGRMHCIDHSIINRISTTIFTSKTLPSVCLLIDSAQKYSFSIFLSPHLCWSCTCLFRSTKLIKLVISDLLVNLFNLLKITCYTMLNYCNVCVRARVSDRFIFLLCWAVSNEIMLTLYRLLRIL